MLARVRALKIGSGPHDDCGPVISRQSLDRLLRAVADAVARGARLAIGGHAAEALAPGYYMEPTVIVDLDEKCRTNQEEIFGPVVTIMPFDSEKEAIRLANGTGYGLSATIWTENLKLAHRVSHQVKSGIIWVNCWLHRDLRTPFGGMKQSGVGREGGWEALRFFTEAKNVCVKL